LAGAILRMENDHRAADRMAVEQHFANDRMDGEVVARSAAASAATTKRAGPNQASDLDFCSLSHRLPFNHDRIDDLLAIKIF